MKREAQRRGRFRQTLSLSVAAQRLHTTRKHVRQLLGSGRLNFVQICGQLRVPREEIERFQA